MSKKVKPEKFTICEYYFNDEVKAKIKRIIVKAPHAILCALKNTAIELINTAIELIKPFVAIGDACAEACLDAYDNYMLATGHWYCVHCDKFHSARTVYHELDTYHYVGRNRQANKVCSIGYEELMQKAIAKEEQNSYNECLDAVAALDKEFERFDRLHEYIEQRKQQEGHNNESTYN